MIIVIILLIITGCNKMVYQQLTFNFNGILDYEQLNSYMEYSLEKPNHIILRSVIMPDSYSVVNKVFTAKYSSKNKNIYYVTLTRLGGTKEKAEGIKYKPEWFGIEITLKIDSFNPEKDEIYYKDLQGEHKIKLGNKKTWIEYLHKESIDIDESEL